MSISHIQSLIFVSLTIQPLEQLHFPHENVGTTKNPIQFKRKTPLVTFLKSQHTKQHANEKIWQKGLQIISLVLGCFRERKLLCRVRELTYPEFPIENEAKGDSLIGMHQTKEVKVWIDLHNLNPCIVLGIN